MQHGLPEKSVMKLLSNYVIIIFDHLYAVRQKLMEHVVSTGGAKMNFQSRAIWVALLVHQEMNKFLDGGGLKTNALLSTAYVRFMTEEHGKSMSYGDEDDQEGDCSTAGSASTAGMTAQEKTSMKNVQKGLTRVRNRCARLERKAGLSVLDANHKSRGAWF